MEVVVGSVGTSVMDSSLVMKTSPAVVTTAYCRSPVLGWMVVEAMWTRIPLAKTISPGRRGFVVITLDAVLGDTVVIAYDKSADRVDGSLYTSDTEEFVLLAACD